MSALRRAARRAAVVLFAVGVLALGYAAYVVIDARVYRAGEQRRLERARVDAAAAAARDRAAAAARALTESAPRVVPREPAEGESIGEISISRLGLVAIVAQGDTPATLRRAVGHLSNTALPGVDGNVVLAGHRDTFFRPLKAVRVRDAITLKTPRGDFEYLVEANSVVRPTDVKVLEPTGGQTLTLITCFPFYYVGAAPNRFIVRARAAERSR